MCRERGRRGRDFRRRREHRRVSRGSAAVIACDGLNRQQVRNRKPVLHPACKPCQPYLVVPGAATRRGRRGQPAIGRVAARSRGKWRKRYHQFATEGFLRGQRDVARIQVSEAGVVPDVQIEMRIRTERVTSVGVGRQSQLPERARRPDVEVERGAVSDGGDAMLAGLLEGSPATIGQHNLGLTRTHLLLGRADGGSRLRYGVTLRPECLFDSAASDKQSEGAYRRHPGDGFRMPDCRHCVCPFKMPTGEDAKAQVPLLSG